MAAVYEDNFGYYDLEADPDEPAFFAFVKSQSKMRKCLRCCWSRSTCSPVARSARDAATRWNTARPPSEKRGRQPVGGLRSLAKRRKG